MAERRGYTGTILWIDLTTRTSELEERDDLFWRRYPGGGLLATRLLLEKTPPGIDPLGPENLLIFASSVVAGHEAAGLVRFTTAAKSPLTGGIGETRTQGPWGLALKRSGADCIVFSGAADAPCVVTVEDGRAAFHDADDLWGEPVLYTTETLEQRFGDNAAVAAIGPAGERMVRFASIVTERTHQASRMGMGAVMGSKKLKAVVLLEGDAPPLASPDTVRALTEDFARRMPENELSRWQKDPPGFSCWLYLHGVDAALCVNNYSKSTFSGTVAFKEEEFLRRYLAPAPCPGCPNDCIKFIHPKGAGDCDERASGIHQEVSGTMGPNLGVGDLDLVLRANNLCNDLGLDPTSLGFTISFAMELFERGILTPADNDGADLRFGDDTGVLNMIEKIAWRDGLGDTLAEGTKRAAETIGGDAPTYAMQVKGLELVCFEPRSQTNLALGYAVAPIGPRYDICEHDWDFDPDCGWEHTLDYSRTLGIVERVGMGHVGPDKVRNFKVLHTLWSAADTFDMCIFAVAPTRLLSMPQMALMLAAVTGWETSDYEIMRAGERRIHLMRWYNLREGLTAADDTLPDRFFDEPIADGPRAGDCLDRAKFSDAVRMYYAMMGWDEQGRPTPATLVDHGLEWVMKSEEGIWSARR